MTWHDDRFSRRPRMSTDKYYAMVLNGFHRRGDSPQVAESNARLESARYAEACRKLPTAYEDPQVYSILTRLDDAIYSAAKLYGYPVETRPVIGTVQSGQINAATVIVPETGEHLLLLDPGLTGLALLMSKVLALSLATPIGDGPKVEFSLSQQAIARRLDSDPQIEQRFLDAVLAFAVHERVGNAQQYFLSGTLGGVAGAFCTSMELFVIGHEYGHIIRGHLRDPAASEAVVVDNAEVARIAYSWDQEFAADAYGGALGVTAFIHSYGGGPALGFVGASAFFGCLEIIERCQTLLQTGAITPRSQGTSSHPPSTERRRHILEVLPVIIDDHEVSDTSVRLAVGVDTAMCELWRRIEPIVHRLHKEGVRPRRVWRAS